jgi:hypothetical protein
MTAATVPPSAVQKWVLPKLGEFTLPVSSLTTEPAASYVAPSLNNRNNGSGSPAVYAMSFPDGPKAVSGMTFTGGSAYTGSPRGNADIASLTYVLFDALGPRAIKRGTDGPVAYGTKSLSNWFDWCGDSLIIRDYVGSIGIPFSGASNTMEHVIETKPLTAPAPLVKASRPLLIGRPSGGGNGWCYGSSGNHVLPETWPFTTGQFAGEAYALAASPFAATNPDGSNNLTLAEARCRTIVGADAGRNSSAAAYQWDWAPRLMGLGTSNGYWDYPADYGMPDPRFRVWWSMGASSSYNGNNYGPGCLANRPWFADFKSAGRYAPRRRSTPPSGAQGQAEANLATNALGVQVTAQGVWTGKWTRCDLFLSDPTDDLWWQGGAGTTAQPGVKVGYYPKGTPASGGVDPIPVPPGGTTPSGGFQTNTIQTWALMTPFGPAWSVIVGDGTRPTSWFVYVIVLSAEQGYPIGYVKLRMVPADAKSLSTLRSWSFGAIPRAVGFDRAGYLFANASYSGTSTTLTTFPGYQVTTFNLARAIANAPQPPNLQSPPAWANTWHECEPLILGLTN